MCGYKTSAPAWVEAIISNVAPFFKDVAGGILTILGGPIVGTAVALTWNWDTLPYPIHGYDMMPAKANNSINGCMPVPVAPYPPPYGVPTGSLYIQTPKVQPICDTSHYVNNAFVPPTYVAGTSSKSICVEPQSTSNYSSFSKACLRITFDNPVRTYSGTTTSSFLSTGADVQPAITTIPNPSATQNNQVEALYASGTLSSCTQNSCHITPSDAHMLIPKAEVFTGGSSSLSNFVGYNLAAFADICYDFSLTQAQQNATTNQVSISDIYGNERTLKVVPGCANPNSNNGVACADNIFYTETQICLYEPPVSGTGTGTFFGCVNRPSMETPQVSFCNQDNTNSSACIQITPPGQDSCSITNYLPSESGTYSTTNTCQSAHNMQITAFLTDNCFNTPESMQSFFQPYITRTESCSTCPTAGQCPNNKIGLCYNNSELVYGGSRLCLYKMPVPLSKPVSRSYCPKDCNAVCVPFSSSTHNPGLCNRVNPPPTTLSPLLPNQYCTPPPLPASGNPTIVTRAKYPIEEGLCVDV